MFMNEEDKTANSLAREHFQHCHYHCKLGIAGHVTSKEKSVFVATLFKIDDKPFSMVTTYQFLSVSNLPAAYPNLSYQKQKTQKTGPTKSPSPSIIQVIYQHKHLTKMTSQIGNFIFQPSIFRSFHTLLVSLTHPTPQLPDHGLL